MKQLTKSWITYWHKMLHILIKQFKNAKSSLTWTWNIMRKERKGAVWTAGRNSFRMCFPKYSPWYMSSTVCHISIICGSHVFICWAMFTKMRCEPTPLPFLKIGQNPCPDSWFSHVVGHNMLAIWADFGIAMSLGFFCSNTFLQYEIWVIHVQVVTTQSSFSSVLKETPAQAGTGWRLSYSQLKIYKEKKVWMGVFYDYCKAVRDWNDVFCNMVTGWAKDNLPGPDLIRFTEALKNSHHYQDLK